MSPNRNLTLTVGDVRAPRRQPVNKEKVPRPLFHANQSQTLALQELLRAYASGEKAMLLIGNQGVGKNKLVSQCE